MYFSALIGSISCLISVAAWSAQALDGESSPSRFSKAIAECKTAQAAQPNRGMLLETKSAVCFAGRITGLAEQVIVKKLDGKNKIFVVNSFGGDAAAAAIIGIFILENRIDVAAYDSCLSACANYIFLAGHRKYLAPSTILAWHGAPEAEPTPRQKLLDGIGRLQQGYQMSQLFYRMAKIDRRVATQPDPRLPHFEEWKSGWDSSRRHFWTWTRQSLERRFGVEGIEAYWYPDDPQELIALGEKYNLKLLVDRDEPR